MLIPTTIVVYTHASQMTKIIMMKYHFQTQKDILTCNARESKPKHNVHKTKKMYKHKKNL
jgi:hypothetical protein